MNIATFGDGSHKITLSQYSKQKPWIENSYDILNELVSSTERADSHPLQHSAMQYREALETLAAGARWT